jgi:hypothetical protein
MAESAEQSRTPVPTVLAAGLLPLAIVGLVLFCFDPRRYHFYPVCFFHETTGLLCAGCGSMRALHQLLHGHLVAAFRFNPLLVICLPFVLWYGGKFAVQRARGGPASLGLRAGWLWLLLALSIMFTILRNMPGLPFTTLPQ